MPNIINISIQVQEANQMVEEMMLLANVAVAEAIAHHFPSCSLLRRHPVITDSTLASNGCRSRHFALLSIHTLVMATPSFVCVQLPWYDCLLVLSTHAKAALVNAVSYCGECKCAQQSNSTHHALLWDCPSRSPI